MAGIYKKYLKAALDGGINLLSDTIKVVFIDDADYTPNFTTDQFYSDVPAAAKVGTPVALANKSTTDGVFDADDPTFVSVSGDQCESLLVYKDTGTASTSPLIAILALGAAVTPNGGNITAVLDNGANRIIKLG